MKQFAKFALVLTVLGALILTGCSGVFAPEGAKRGQGQGLTIKLSGGGSDARTLYPKDAFSKYVLTFEGPSITSHDDVTLENGRDSIDVLLMEGDWTINAYAYVMINGEEYLAAEGGALVTMPSDRLDITVYAKQETGEKGFFSYLVSYPDGVEVNDAGLWIYKFGSAEPSLPTVNLLSEPEGTLELDPGFYIMIIRLGNDMQAAVRQEIVHIYSKMETADEAGYVFESADFSGVITVGGAITATINGQPADEVRAVVMLADGLSFIAEAEVADGGWSAKFIEPDGDIIVEFTVERGNVKAVEKTAPIDIKDSGADLESINFSRAMLGTFNPAQYNIGGTVGVTATAAGLSGPAYRWKADGVDISGAAANSSYTVTGDIAGSLISCDITFPNGLVITVTGEKAKYNIKISVSGNVAGDSISFNALTAVTETSGVAGDDLVLYYAVAGSNTYNGVHFSGLDSVQIESALYEDHEGGGGTVSYAVDDADVSAGGTIDIIVTFEHTALWRDPITFGIPQGNITRTYGSGALNNPVTTDHNGTGAVTYSSANEAVATVDENGVVTLIKVGTTIITANKEEDATYASATASYTLTVTPKIVTILGMSATEKEYDGTTDAAAIVSGTPSIDGLVGADDVTVILDPTPQNAPKFEDKNAGTGKTVIVSFVIYSATPGLVDNYALAYPAAVVTADITPKDVSIINMGVDDKPYDGTKAAAVKAYGVTNISGRIGNDDVYPADGTAEFASEEPAANLAVTFSGWKLDGADAGNYNLTGQPNPATASINKADPTVVWPEGLTTLFGNTLAEVDLTLFMNAEGSTVGIFTWTDDTTATGTADGSGAKRVGIQTYQMVFSPIDSARYNVVRANIGVRVTLGVEMVSINAGNFSMGQAGIAEPVHTVIFTAGFRIGTYQVTQRQYAAVTGTLITTQQSTASAGSTNYGRGPDYPMYYVNWYEAVRFCNLLSIAEGLTPAYRINNSTAPADWGTVPSSNNAIWNAAEIVVGSTGYRLPTEAQWEYACRAGTTTTYYWGDDIAVIGDYGWYDVNAGAVSHAVGTKTANAWGLYDMAGNVLEWCWDLFGEYPSSSAVNPTGPDTTSLSPAYRMMRGGGWNSNTFSMRSANRVRTTPYMRSSNVYSLGLRLVRPLN